MYSPFGAFRAPLGRDIVLAVQAAVSAVPAPQALYETALEEPIDAV